MKPKAVYINWAEFMPFEAIEFINTFKEDMFCVYMGMQNVSPYNALIERYEKSKRILLN